MVGSSDHNPQTSGDWEMNAQQPNYNLGRTRVRKKFTSPTSPALLGLHSSLLRVSQSNTADQYKVDHRLQEVECRDRSRTLEVGSKNQESRIRMKYLTQWHLPRKLRNIPTTPHSIPECPMRRRQLGRKYRGKGGKRKQPLIGATMNEMAQHSPPATIERYP